MRKDVRAHVNAGYRLEAMRRACLAIVGAMFGILVVMVVVVVVVVGGHVGDTTLGFAMSEAELISNMLRPNCRSTIYEHQPTLTACGSIGPSRENGDALKQGNVKL